MVRPDHDYVDVIRRAAPALRPIGPELVHGEALSLANAEVANQIHCNFIVPAVQSVKNKTYRRQHCQASYLGPIYRRLCSPQDCPQWHWIECSSGVDI